MRYQCPEGIIAALSGNGCVEGEIWRDIEKRSEGIFSRLLGHINIAETGDFSALSHTAIRGGMVPTARPRRYEYAWV